MSTPLTIRSFLARISAHHVLVIALLASLILAFQTFSFFICWDVSSYSDPTTFNLSLVEQHHAMVEQHQEEPCSRTTHSTETFWVAMPAWDDREGLHRALDSVKTQSYTGYGKIHVVVFEDYSSDNMLHKEEKTAYEGQMDVTFLRNEAGPNKGSAYGKWVLFEWIRRHALPHEYILVLDGDDTLADEWVVRDIRNALQERKPWFAWGSHNGKYNDQCHNLTLEYPGQPIREAGCSFCHPRMFQSHLLHHLEPVDFQRDDGEWLQKATDRPFIFKFMEMAGTERILYLEDRPLYNYTMGSHNGLKIFPKEVFQGDKIAVNNRPAASQTSEIIHVVACIYDRDNTENFLTHLALSELEPNQELKVHICNNNITRQHDLEDLADWLHRKLPHKFEINDMGGNHGGYSRFLLSRQVMAREFVDYIIMIDDDQYVTPTTISEVYAKREPQTYKSWYGKNWALYERSYWEPCCDMRSMTTDPRLRAGVQTNIATYQYGGTGMSIIDAAIFDTKELFDLEEKYLFIEDVWLSYVVQLLRWPIQRLFVTFDTAGTKFENATGQWSDMISLKTEFFQKVGRLQCSPELRPDIMDIQEIVQMYAAMRASRGRKVVRASNELGTRHERGTRRIRSTRRKRGRRSESGTRMERRYLHQ